MIIIRSNVITVTRNYNVIMLPGLARGRWKCWTKHFLVLSVCYRGLRIPYSAYISRVKIFAIFANSIPFAKIFQRRFWHFAPSPVSTVYLRNFFNEIVKSSNSRKFRSVKYKRYTVLCSVLRIMLFLYALKFLLLCLNVDLLVLTTRTNTTT